LKCEIRKGGPPSLLTRCAEELDFGLLEGVNGGKGLRD
jgi:hypothetical protein